jgi:hypothetical protein
MVLLKNLNKICSKRNISHAIPAQIACRILGNKTRPCALDPLCKKAALKGVWLFYIAFVAGISIFFLITFWVLRITRLQFLIKYAFRLLAPPTAWICKWMAKGYNFYRNLPF